MRLKKPLPEIREQLTHKLAWGYKILQDATQRYESQFKNNPSAHLQWQGDVFDYLKQVFPTYLEANEFIMAPQANPDLIVTGNNNVDAVTRMIRPSIAMLDKILSQRLLSYPELPILERLYVEDIDGFSLVRSVNAHEVSKYLKNGRINLLEDTVQLALEQILAVSFHQNDSGAEQNDLFTANTEINGKRRQSAFLLKGRGCTSREMQISDCGSNGDQIVKLFKSPADIFFVQYVGQISQAVIDEMSTHTRDRRSKGLETHFCTIDGTDTARLLLAYNKTNAFEDAK